MQDDSKFLRRITSMESILRIMWCKEETLENRPKEFKDILVYTCIHTCTHVYIYRCIYKLAYLIFQTQRILHLARCHVMEANQTHHVFFDCP